MPKERYYQGKKDRMDESRGMKDKYYQGSKDKMDERRGMKDKYYRDMEREFYVSGDDRKRAELEDSGMIREDRYATANLPQEVIMRPYPKGSYGYEKGLNDTLRGIDMQMDDDSGKMKKEAYPEKY